LPCLVLPLSGVLSSIPGQKPCRPPTNPACQVSQQRELNQRQQSQFSIQCHSAASANPFRAPSWHFRGVASSLLGPHQTGARATTLNLTPQPHDQPHDPLTLLETTRQLAISRVWRAPSRAHIHASWFSRPTLVPQPPPPHGFT